MIGQSVYVNGRFVPTEKASVSVFDRGLLYGDGLFETILTRSGVPVFLDEHLERLSSGACLLRLDEGEIKRFIDKDARRAVAGLIRRNGLVDADSIIRITITRGASLGNYAMPPDTKATIIIFARPVPKGALAVLNKGVEAVTTSAIIPAIPHVKTLNFLPNILAKDDATSRGAYEAIFTRGRYALEASGANLFIVEDGRIVTPKAGDVLPGVMRRIVIEEAKKNGLKVLEKAIRTNYLFLTDEVFLTNSITGVVSVLGIDGNRIGRGVVGPLTSTVRRLVEARIRLAASNMATSKK